MLSTKIRTTVITLVAVGTLVITGVASAAMVQRSALNTKPVVARTKVVALEAFPAGKGSVEEQETCDEWTRLLQGDQKEINDAVENNNLKQYVTATNALSADTNSALDAGCGVID
jgi:hypothetical protein